MSEKIEAPEEWHASPSAYVTGHIPSVERSIEEIVERANRNGYHALVVPSDEHVYAQVNLQVPPGMTEEFNALLHAELVKAELYRDG